VVATTRFTFMHLNIS